MVLMELQENKVSQVLQEGLDYLVYLARKVLQGKRGKKAMQVYQVFLGQLASVVKEEVLVLLAFQDKKDRKENQ